MEGLPVKRINSIPCDKVKFFKIMSILASWRRIGPLRDRLLFLCNDKDAFGHPNLSKDEESQAKGVSEWLGTEYVGTAVVRVQR